MESEWEPIVQWCKDILKAENRADARTKMRANELLVALMDKGVGVAVDLDKMDRLDRGQSTENVNYGVRYLGGVSEDDL
jgi:hypothetical protein